METVVVGNTYEQKIRDGGYKFLVRVAEHILLRPNDTALLMGQEKFNKLKQTEELILEEYKNDEIYKYYYELNNHDHGFCSFDRWKRGLLF
jgi:hypothetical protein